MTHGFFMKIYMEFKLQNFGFDTYNSYLWKISQNIHKRKRLLRCAETRLHFPKNPIKKLISELYWVLQAYYHDVRVISGSCSEICTKFKTRYPLREWKNV